MKFSYRLPIAAILFSLIPAAAHACSACILADPRTSGTYLKMTLIMSALPLGLLGGLTFWLWRRYSPQGRATGLTRQSVGNRPNSNALEHRA
ncbi:MAG: hypothetical protein ABSA57_17320 [Candidatus Acidiferrales bacterium]|jgi:hypothetical protein